MIDTNHAWQLGVAALSGGGIGWLTNFLQDKTKSRAYTMGAVDAAVQTAMKAQNETIDRLQEEINRLQKEVDSLREAHANCGERLEEMQKKLQELKNAGPA